MEQFNSKTYKKQTAIQEFRHSCLGKIIILIAFCCIVLVVAAMNRPSDSMMRWQMDDHIYECLQASDSITNDAIDDYVGNIGRIFTHTDSTLTDKEMLETYKQLNRLEIYTHTFYKTAYVRSNIHPEGVRVGIGIFGIVIPTIKYADLLMNTGAIRGDYGERLIRDITLPSNYTGENPNVQPYHYKGDPDN